MTSARIEGEAHAPARLVACVQKRVAGDDQRLDARAIEIAALNRHTLAVRPVQLSRALIDFELLGREGPTGRDNRRHVGAVALATHDEAVVLVGASHVRPVDMASGRVNGDAVIDA